MGWGACAMWSRGKVTVSGETLELPVHGILVSVDVNCGSHGQLTEAC